MELIKKTGVKMSHIETIISERGRLFVSIEDLIKSLQLSVKEIEEKMKSITNDADGRVAQGTIEGIEGVEKSLREMELT